MIKISFTTLTLFFSSLINISFSQEFSPPSTIMEVKSSFSGAVKKVSPAVVNIFTEKVVETRGFNPFASDPFFSEFFGGGMSSGMKSRVERSLGSGVIVTKDGYMVTNYHVIKGADSVKVVLQDRREVVAKFISADPNTDLAIMKITPKNSEFFPHIEFGDSDALEVGDVVLAIGNPYGVGQSVSMGIVSAVGRSGLNTGKYENYIQTDAAINPGNSGGALIDSLGRLVGISTAIYSKSGGSQGIAFATPSNSVKNIMSSILATGKILRPWLGIGAQDMSSDLSEQLGLERVTGILVNEVLEDSPADRAGIRVGDIILKFDEYDVTSKSFFDARVAGSLVNQEYPFLVWREGKTYSADVFLENIPDRKEEDRYTVPGSASLGGFTFETITPALSLELGLPMNSKGVVVVGVPDRGSRFVQLLPGDIVLELNGKEVQTLADLKIAAQRKSRSIDMSFRRGSVVSRIVVK